MDDLHAKILARARELEDDTVRFLADIVRIPSHSTHEEVVAGRIQREMERIGLDEVRIDGLGNVIGRLGDGPRVIAFDAHIDVVYPGHRDAWEFDPFAGEVAGGRLRGRGAADQKGGMAAMIAAARIMKEMDLARGLTVYFTGTVMEEDCDGLCWLYLVREEAIRPELVVITEPTSLRIHRGQRGRMEIMVRIAGRSAHGSAPERGDNAIYKMARIALEIERLNERLAVDPFLGKGTVVVSQFFFTAPSACAVPDSAAVQLDRRLTAGETADSALAEVRDAARRAGYPDAVVELLRYDEPAYTGRRYPMSKYYPTWVLDEDSPYLRAAADCYAALFSEAPAVDRWTFSTNGVAIAGLCGIPCLGFGPGDETMAHAPNESCPVDHLHRAAAFYAALAARLGGGAGGAP